MLAVTVLIKNTLRKVQFAIAILGFILLSQGWIWNWAMVNFLGCLVCSYGCGAGLLAVFCTSLHSNRFGLGLGLRWNLYLNANFLHWMFFVDLRLGIILYSVLGNRLLGMDPLSKTWTALELFYMNILCLVFLVGIYAVVMWLRKELISKMYLQQFLLYIILSRLLSVCFLVNGSSVS